METGAHADVFVFFLTVFVLAVFVGYYVVWRVTPALHSPLMSVTNAVSSVIIVGALIAAGPAGVSFSKVMGFVAVTLASVNIFGCFIMALRGLSSPETARGGNLYGIIGMVIAIGTTLASPGVLSYGVIAGGIVIGGSVD